MNYPFRMFGRTVQVYRYQAVYTELRRNEEGERVETEVARYFPTEEEAQAEVERAEKRTGKTGTVTALDPSAYEWMDGIVVDDVPSTYGEAVKIYEMGESGYQAALAKAEQEKAALAQTIENAAAVNALLTGEE